MYRPLVTAFVLLSACTANTVHPFVMEGECTKTCSAARLDCEGRGARAANRCYATCFEHWCYNVCEGAGDQKEDECLAEIEGVCGSNNPGCAEHTFGARLGSAVPEIEEACREHFAACGNGTDPEVCTQFSHVEGIATTDVYECMTANSCSREGCPYPVADTELATATCDALTACEWGCVDDVDLLADQFGWLRPDVRETLRDCLTLPCAQGRGVCVATWFAAVYPQ